MQSTLFVSSSAAKKGETIILLRGWIMMRRKQVGFCTGLFTHIVVQQGCHSNKVLPRW